MSNKRLIANSSDTLTPIEDVANVWEVDPRTIKNWVGYTYQAFEILLPSNGPFPAWGAELLNLAGKHISNRASLYFAETGESRRLKATEYVKKIRSLRSQGHFAEFDQYRNFQKSQNFQTTEAAEDLEDESLAEFGNITRQIDREIEQAKGVVQAYEDQKVEEFADFLDKRPQRMMSSLSRRLKELKPASGSMNDAIDVAYRRLPD